MTTLPVPRPTRSSLSSKLSFVLGMVGILAASPSALAAPGHPATNALDELAGKKGTPSLIQNRFFVKSNRFEIAPSIGYVPNNSFVTSVYGGAFAAYHFSETFSAEGAFFYAPNTGVSGVKGLTETLVVIAHDGNPDNDTFRQPLDRLQLGAIFSARWAPVYGKINLIGEGVLNFDVYGTGGVGLLLVTKDYATYNPDFDSDPTADPALVETSPATEAYPALNLGVGMDFFLTQTIALKLDVRGAFYIADEPDYGNELPNGEPAPLEKRLYNTLMTTGGISIFIPRMKPRLFNF